MNGRNLRGVSRLIMVCPPSDEDCSFHQADGSQIAIPPLHRVLLDEAVTTEQLDAVGADLHAVLRRQSAGQRDLAREVEALLGARGGLERYESHALELDRDVGDHE